MKYASALLLVTLASTAHAELLAPRGAKAELKVEYVFTSSGNHNTGSASIEQIDIWKVRRVVSMTAQYAAEAPQAFGVLHKEDGKQKADMAAMQAKTASAAKKLEPMQNDMMAIAAKCGISMDGPDVSAAEEKAQEACVEKAVANYSNTTQMTPEMKSAATDIAAVTKMAGTVRFQLWKPTSQSGTYSIDENVSKQVFEMTCTNTKVCKRVETVKGGGAIPAPPGGNAVPGASMLEVDNTGRDMALYLPMPLVPLPVTRTVTTTIIDDDSKGGASFATLWKNAPITVTIPADLKTLSGTQTIAVSGDGDQTKEGTLTVKWQFTRN